ncbi:LADA_0H05072g1_1 [Lachancea dasiensis]|uniref:LADA_0H05072g1_1 n=1 Tax=Lachancea dasiensis TaxID=1072105 RepID=A0A1G4K165_9SACH|nr:LADA_0H05072g1_1 [Lachancea dasiensis]
MSYIHEIQFRMRMKRHFHIASSVLRKAVSSLDDPNTVSQAAKLLYRRAGQLEPAVEIKRPSEIQSGLNERYYNSYLIPSREWCKHNEINWASMKDCLNMDLRALSTKHQKNLEHYIDSNLFDKCNSTFLIDIKKLRENSLNVGDVVLLRSDPSQLCMCVEVPTDIMNPSYTFATVDGHVKFASRNSVLLRMPSFHSKPVNYLVREEIPYLDTPVGTVKDNPNQTFILPVLARLLYSSYIPFEITRAAWNRMATVTKKLELLHRFLQKSDGPWQISYIKLCELVALLDLQKCRSTSTVTYLNELMATVGVSPLQGVSENLSNLKPPQYLDSANFLATYWALVQQQEHYLWGEIHLHRAMLTPISVTVLPLRSRHLYYDSLVRKLKKNDYAIFTRFAHHFNAGNTREALDTCPDIYRMLMDFAAGNFQKNGIIITTISKLFRKLDDYKYSDITRDLSHELIQRLRSPLDGNPLLANDGLALTSVSGEKTIEDKIYDFALPLGSQDVTNRHNFQDMRVYCIDSADAHEIDDGISIEFKGTNRYALHVHIADPVSLFGNTFDKCVANEVWKVALARSFTCYLPDYVKPMLPSTYSKAGDLGKDGSETKTLSFSIDVECEDDHLQLLEDTFQIRLGTVKRFPRVTYDSVDKLLASKVDSTNEEFVELSAIYKVATLLRRKRVEDGGAIVFGDGFNKGLVKIKDTGTMERGGSPAIEFEDQKVTPSTLMVSELMILANTMTGNYFATHGIPGVFRSYKELALKGKAFEGYEQLRSLTRSHDLPSVKDIAKLSSLLNSSFYTGHASNHDMIGAPAYLTVTSPLRRFPDLINHLQLHAHLKQWPQNFSQYAIDEMLWHIQSRDVILKKAAQHSATCWTLKYLKSQQHRRPGVRYSVMITSVPQMGLVRCVLPDLSAARGVLKLRPEIASKWSIGDVVHNCKITKLDCLDGVMELEVPPTNCDGN